jgi:outer membrane protein
MKMKLALFILTMFTGMVLSAETLSLEACIAMARKGNPVIQQQALTSEIAESKHKQAYSAVMPNVSLSSGLSASDANDWELAKSLNLQAGMTLYTPGLYSGIRAAAKSSELSEVNQISTENDMISQISALYYRILSTRKLMQVYQANIELADENLRKTRAMYEMKVITESDVLKSEAQKGEFESQLLKQRQAYKSYLRAMNILLGRDPSQPLELEEVDVGVVNIPEYEVAENQMLKNNPDYRAVLIQESINKLNLQAGKETYLPSVSGSYQYSNYLDQDLQPSNGVSLSASWTLFNGLSRRQKVQQGKLQLRQTQIEISNTQRSLKQLLQDLYNEFETYTAMIEINQRRLRSARRDFELVNQQYELGKVTMLERMQSQIAVLSAESSLVEAQYSRKQVEAEILKLINKI